jgi:hypothetical protein
MQKKILRNNLLILILLFLIASCSIISQLSQDQKEKLLTENLGKLSKFKLEGLIEVNYKAFSFRKNIIIKKNGNILRLDIFDSGLMGLAPAPFMSAYLDTSLVLKLPGNEELSEISAEKLQKELHLLDYIRNIEQLLQFKADIISDNHLQLESINIFFSEAMQIREISQAEKDYKIELIYDEELSEIFFSHKGKIAAHILIDKILFSEVNINVLNK